MVKLILLSFVAFPFLVNDSGYRILIPVNIKDRHSVHKMELTEIGKFGILRKARKNIPAHFHTGIDIKRPNPNYKNEPVFPMAPGIVISKRDDGPYAQLIVEHSLNNKTIWTVYEHIAGILVEVNDSVDPNQSVARFMNKSELNKFGWQFDHFHFEILKVRPIELVTNAVNPGRRFNSYSLNCYSRKDLEKYFFDPEVFFNLNLK